MSDVELSAPIQPDAMTELRNAFAEFDKDSDGHITKEELAGVMGNFGHIISPQDLDNVIKLVDTDGNGVVDFKVRSLPPRSLPPPHIWRMVDVSHLIVSAYMKESADNKPLRRYHT